MEIVPLHAWDISPPDAVRLQTQLAHEVITEDRFNDPVRTVGGVDAGIDLKLNVCRCVVVILDFPSLELLEKVEAIAPLKFPYIPGLLSFREVPAVIKALEKLRKFPDLLICDGLGIAHPRRFGIACHIGVVTDIPTIGAAKSFLVGGREAPGPMRGEMSPMFFRGEQVGVALRTKDKVKPLYISPGHLVSLETSVDYVQRCITKYKLPEPTRLADKLASYRKV